MWSDAVNLWVQPSRQNRGRHAKPFPGPSRFRVFASAAFQQNPPAGAMRSGFINFDGRIYWMVSQPMEYSKLDSLMRLDGSENIRKKGPEGKSVALRA
jgi:hypothetical protein